VETAYSHLRNYRQKRRTGAWCGRAITRGKATVPRRSGRPERYRNPHSLKENASRKEIAEGQRMAGSGKRGLPLIWRKKRAVCVSERRSGRKRPYRKRETRRLVKKKRKKTEKATEPLSKGKKPTRGEKRFVFEGKDARITSRRSVNLKKKESRRKKPKTDGTELAVRSARGRSCGGEKTASPSRVTFSGRGQSFLVGRLRPSEKGHSRQSERKSCTRTSEKKTNEQTGANR